MSSLLQKTIGIFLLILTNCWGLQLSRLPVIQVPPCSSLPFSHPTVPLVPGGAHHKSEQVFEELVAKSPKNLLEVFPEEREGENFYPCPHPSPCAYPCFYPCPYSPEENKGEFSSKENLTQIKAVSSGVLREVKFPILQAEIKYGWSPYGDGSEFPHLVFSNE